MDDLLSEFIAETRETLEAIAGEIVAWEADPADRARLDHVFRFVHTVKGSCGFLDLPRLGRLAHAAEDVLARVRDGARMPDRALVSAVLAIIDRIRDTADAIERGESLPDDDATLIAALSPGGAVVSLLPDTRTRVMARSIRVPVDLLDRMMAGVSDLVLARNELARRVRGQAEGEGAVERLTQALDELRDTITRTRMARIEQLFTALPRIVRDLAGALGREVTLAIEGGGVELDRELIEMIRDPLTHIVRNAIDHGIEPPAERIAAGKPRAGRLCISARQAGNRILIDVTDDGRGIDTRRLVSRAIAAGIVSAARAASLSAAQRLELVFAPGLSTRSEASQVSGRGVGMDVVRANVAPIGGEVSIESEAGRGVRLRLSVPLTLTIIPALTVSAGGETFAIPLAATEEIVRVRAGAARLDRVCGASVATIRGQPLPAVMLARVLGMDDPPECALLVLLRLAGGARFAIGVDAVHDHEELVVKPAAPAVMATGLYAGVTLPDDNRPMLLLDVSGIALAGGIALVPAAVTEPIAADHAPEPFAAVLFRGLDGVERAVRLALVERIEDVDRAQVGLLAGRLRLERAEGAPVPLFGGELPTDAARLRVLHLRDGANAIAYAVAQVIDIVDVAASAPPAAEAVVSAVVADGRTIALLDPHRLFAEAARGRGAGGDHPLALLADGDARWTREVLRPLVEAAGYVVTFAGEPGAERADVVLTASEAVPDDAPGAAVVRLRARKGADGSVSRDDMAALTAALARARATGDE